MFSLMLFIVVLEFLSSKNIALKNYFSDENDLSFPWD